jgi:hypothetical protein
MPTPKLNFEAPETARLTVEIINMMEKVDAPIDMKVAALSSASFMLQNCITRMGIAAMINGYVNK